MVESLLAGAILRFFQALIQATPTILIGFIIAAVFRRFLGHSGTRRIFGDNGWRSLPQAWLIGMLLPVCSLGVIPVVREMRKAGVSGGAILAFGLTAPLFNPISVLYGLTLADPIVILTFTFCSLLIVTVMGLGWDKFFPNEHDSETETPAVAFGVKRMLSVAVYVGRELFGPSSLYILVGLVGVSVLSLILPPGALQSAAEHTDPWAPLFMTVVAIPAYATPMTAMVQLASMFQHGNSVGAAFALLVLGAGANVGLVAWMARNFGAKRTGLWFAMLLLVVVALAYGVDRPLYPEGVEPAGHSHAFDIYCAPFRPDTGNPWFLAVKTLGEKIAAHEIIGVFGACCFFLVGLGLKVWDSKERVENWLEREPKAKPKADIIIPGVALGFISLAGLVILSVVGCYIYYPPPNEVFEEMSIVNTDVGTSVTSQDWDTALYWIPVYDDWTRKLQVSMYLRGEELTPYRRAKAKVLRDKLEELEHAVKDKEPEEARELGIEVSKAYRRLKTAYSP